VDRIIEIYKERAFYENFNRVGMCYVRNNFRRIIMAADNATTVMDGRLDDKT
jgi:hypothetical protein